MALLSILFIGFAAVYISIRISTAWESATQTVDPVVYQHFYWIEVDTWFATAYFLVPNIILIGLFALWRFRTTKENSNDGGG